MADLRVAMLPARVVFEGICSRDITALMQDAGFVSSREEAVRAIAKGTVFVEAANFDRAQVRTERELCHFEDYCLVTYGAETVRLECPKD